MSLEAASSRPEVRGARCTVCNSRNVSVFSELRQVPVHCNLLWPTREGALDAPRGDMQLSFCRDCGHIFNLSFQQEQMQYTQAYENSLHFSPRFQSYANSLADRLIERYNLYNKDIIDIGCGKGDFLAMLCEKGKNRGVGFDPSYVAGNMSKADTGRMTMIQDFYSPRYSAYKADVIVCRHVLEHIQHPREFLQNVSRAIGDRKSTAVYLEVPNVMYTLKDMGIWDLIYEHCSYFSSASLSRLFVDCGFKIRDQRELYEGQFLGIEAVPLCDDRQPPMVTTESLRDLTASVDIFAEKYRAKVESWREILAQLASAGQRAAIWGGGSKGVMFLNTLKPSSAVSWMVDINPRKHGMYVAGSGQEIVPPEFLREHRPDTVIIMNPIYKDEIQGILRMLGINASVLVA